MRRVCIARARCGCRAGRGVIVVVTVGLDLNRLFCSVEEQRARSVVLAAVRVGVQLAVDEGSVGAGAAVGANRRVDAAGPVAIGKVGAQTAVGAHLAGVDVGRHVFIIGCAERACLDNHHGVAIATVVATVKGVRKVLCGVLIENGKVHGVKVACVLLDNSAEDVGHLDCRAPVLAAAEGAEDERLCAVAQAGRERYFDLDAQVGAELCCEHAVLPGKILPGHKHKIEWERLCEKRKVVAVADHLRLLCVDTLELTEGVHRCGDNGREVCADKKRFLLRNSAIHPVPARFALVRKAHTRYPPLGVFGERPHCDLQGVAVHNVHARALVLTRAEVGGHLAQLCPPERRRAAAVDALCGEVRG